MLVEINSINFLKNSKRTLNAAKQFIKKPNKKQVMQEVIILKSVLFAVKSKNLLTNLFRKNLNFEKKCYQLF